MRGSGNKASRKAARQVVQRVLEAELVTSAAAKQTFTTQAFVAAKSDVSAHSQDADMGMEEGAPRRLRSLRLSASRPARLRVAQRLGKQLPGSGNAPVTRPARRDARRDGSSSLPSHLHNLLRRDLSTAGFTGFLPNPDALDEPMVDSATLAAAAVDAEVAEAVVPEVAAPEVAAPEVAAPEVAVPEVVVPELAEADVAATEVTVSRAAVTDARREPVVLRALPAPKPMAFPIVHVKTALPARREPSLLHVLQVAAKPAARPAASSGATPCAPTPPAPSAVAANPVVDRRRVEESRRIHTGETCKYCRRQYALDWLACPTCGALAMSARPRRRKPPAVAIVTATRPVLVEHVAAARIAADRAVSVSEPTPARVVRPQRPAAPSVEIEAADRSALWTYVIGGVILVVMVLFFLGVI
ncbi:MAG: hypothetical protein KDC95_06245 [Planctomycetes bacterium]|nr:hypothetical protein [Planctomycetota bacterium]